MLANPFHLFAGKVGLECYEPLFQSSNGDPKIVNRVRVGRFRGSVRLKCQAIDQPANLLTRSRLLIQTASVYMERHSYRIVTLRPAYLQVPDFWLAALLEAFGGAAMPPQRGYNIRLRQGLMAIRNAFVMESSSQRVDSPNRKNSLSGAVKNSWDQSHR